MPSCTITASSTVTAHLAKASVTSFSSSLVYMKRVLPVAMTNIVFHRIDYDNKFFTPHTIKDTPYMTLRHGLPKKSELMSLYRQMQDVVVFMDKKCLEELYLVFLEKETKKVIEHYRFQIVYNPEDDGDMPTGVAVLEDTSNLFQNINDLSKNNKIDWNGIEISMQLNLNNKAPSNYNSKQFEKSSPLVSPSSPEIYTDIGCISTGYHKMCLKAKGNIFSLTDGHLVHDQVENEEVQQNISDEVNVEENNFSSPGNEFDTDQFKLKTDEKETSSVQFGTKTKQKTKNKKEKKPKESLIAQNETNVPLENTISRGKHAQKKEKQTLNKKPECKESDVESEINGPPRKKRSIRRINSADLEKEPTDNSKKLVQNNQGTSKVANQHDIFSNDVANVSENNSVEFIETNDVLIKCTCNVNYLLDSIELITCTFCKTNQHVACNGYKSAFSIPEPYVCHNCQPTSAFEPVDVRMQLKKSHQKPFLALLRLLCLYYNTHKDVQMVINNLPLTKKDDIIKRLIGGNVIYIDDNGKYTCSEAFVNNIVNGYFFYPETKQDVMDSMVLE